MIVGLTGGIGSGKSTVSSMFEDLGIHIVDTDIISREVVEKNSPGLDKITQHFGESVLLEDGSLNRAELRKIIFADNKQRTWLENLLHPLIHQLTEQKLSKEANPYCILSSPLLLETADKHRVNRIVVVDIPFKEQLVRTIARDNTDEEQIKSIIAAQLPREERLSFAHDVIDNSGGLAKTRQQVVDLHEKYLTLTT